MGFRDHFIYLLAFARQGAGNIAGDGSVGTVQFFPNPLGKTPVKIASNGRPAHRHKQKYQHVQDDEYKQQDENRLEKIEKLNVIGHVETP